MTLASAAGVRCIPLPMDGHPLRAVNAYLIECDDGFALIDCGWGTPRVLHALREGLAATGAALDNLRSLIITHHHLDHYGLAGTIAGLSEARVMMHRLDWIFADTRQRDWLAEMRRRDAWLLRNGFDPAACADLDERVRTFQYRTSVAVPFRQLADDDVIDLGGRRLRVIWTPGHTEGHVCLYDDDSRTLFSGDHVLGGITPHIGTWGDSQGDVLARICAGESTRSSRTTRSARSKSKACSAGKRRAQ